MRELISKPTTIVLALLTAIAACVAFAAGTTTGAFTGAIANSANSSGAATLQYTHNYSSTSCTNTAISNTTTSCNKSFYPQTTTSSVTDGIKNTGTTVATGETVSIASCGVVQAVNTLVSSDPMFPRNAATYNGTTGGPLTGAGSITLNGTNGYLSDFVGSSNPQPTNLALGIAGTSYAVGIWFKTSSTAGGTLFGFGNQPNTTSTTIDRVLSMNANGTLTFRANTSSSSTIGTTTAAYNDNAWHYAYVTFQNLTLLSLGAPVISLYIDGGTSPVLTSSSVTLSTAYTGYWHVGYVNSSTSYFAGSVSDFTVFNGGTGTFLTNASTLYSAGTQATYASRVGAAGANLLWPFADNGTSTYTGVYPSGGTTTPCAMVNIKWSFTNPTSCAVSPQSITATCSTTALLSTFANGTAQSVGTPAIGATQSSVIAFSRASTYNTLVTGLIGYTPTTIQMTAGSWQVNFVWNSAGATLLF